MANEMTMEEAQRALQGVTIPPRPTVLVEINAEFQKSNPDLNKISSKIATDVGMYASMLKVVNSPFFGLRSKVGSAAHAVQILGLKNVKSIVTGIMLRSSVPGEKMTLERFWDNSEKVARISAYLGSILINTSREDAYTFGLFRECGIPLLMQRFPNYKETLKFAAGQNKPLPQIEDERHGTNHAMVGYMVAKAWGLPEGIPEAILRHHDLTVFSPTDEISSLSRTLIAVNFLAEHLNETVLRMRDDRQWEEIDDMILAHLGVSHAEYEDIKDEIVNITS